MNYLPTIFLASYSELPYTSSWSILSKNSCDFNQLPTERKKSPVLCLDGQVFRVPASAAISVSFLYDPEIMLPTSLFWRLNINILHDELKYHLFHNSVPKFPCLLWAFWIWYVFLIFLSGMVTALSRQFLPLIKRLRFQVLGIPWCPSSRRLSIKVCHFVPKKLWKARHLTFKKYFILAIILDLEKSCKDNTNSSCIPFDNLP